MLATSTYVLLGLLCIAAKVALGVHPLVSAALALGSLSSKRTRWCPTQGSIYCAVVACTLSTCLSLGMIPTVGEIVPFLGLVLLITSGAQEELTQELHFMHFKRESKSAMRKALASTTITSPDFRSTANSSRSPQDLFRRHSTSLIETNARESVMSKDIIEIFHERGDFQAIEPWTVLPSRIKASSVDALVGMASTGGVQTVIIVLPPSR